MAKQTTLVLSLVGLFVIYVVFAGFFGEQVKFIPLWQKDIPVLTRPALEGSILVTHTSTGEVYALNTETQEILWSKELTPNYLEAGPLIHRGTVFSAGSQIFGDTRRESLVALDLSTGELKWEAPLEGPFESEVVLGTKALYVSDNYAGRLLAVEPTTGGVLWRSSVAEDVLSTPQECGEVVVIPGREAVYALNRETGQLVWKSEVRESFGKPECNEKLAFVATPFSELIAFKLEDGSRVWEMSLARSQALDPIDIKLSDEVLYVPTGLGLGLKAINPKDRKVLWSANLAEETYSLPEVRDGKVYIATKRGSLFVLDAKDGRRLGKIKVGTRAGPPLVEGDTVFVGAGNSGLFAFEVRNNKDE